MIAGEMTSWHKKVCFGECLVLTELTCVDAIFVIGLDMQLYLTTLLCPPIASVWLLFGMWNTISSNEHVCSLF